MLAQLPLATTRFVAISKSGGTAETLMQTAAVIAALKAAKRDPHDHLLGISEPVKSGKANGLRDLLGPHNIPMIDHDPGVGGRFSVLSNVGLLPAAVCGLDIGAIRAGAAAALAPVLAGKPPAEVPAAVGAALSVALRQADHRDDGLLRPTRPLHQVVRAALGREPWQGRQGHHADRRARPGRPAQPASALSWPGRATSCSRSSLSAPPAAARASTPNWPNAPDEPGLGGKTIGDLVAAQGRATAETLAKNGCPVRTIHSTRSTRQHSANC